VVFINVNCSSINITDFRFHRRLPEFEQESDSQIKKFRAGILIQKFGTGAESKNVAPATSSMQTSCNRIVYF